MIKNTITKKAEDVRGVVFRLILFIGLLFAISIILDGCTAKTFDPITILYEDQLVDALADNHFR